MNVFEDDMSAEQIDRVMYVDDKVIHGFFREYRWLSNFHVCEVVYGGDLYPSPENACQAAKVDRTKRAMFFNCSPKEAKRLGGLCTIDVQRSEEIKYDVMSLETFSKYRDNPGLA